MKKKIFVTGKVYDLGTLESMKLKMKFRRIWIRFLMLVESDSG